MEDEAGLVRSDRQAKGLTQFSAISMRLGNGKMRVSRSDYMAASKMGGKVGWGF